MKRTRHTPEQIIRKLREAERLLASGKDVEEVCLKGSKTRSASCCPSVLVDEPA